MIQKRDIVLIGGCALLAIALLLLLPLTRPRPAPEAKLYLRYRVEGRDAVLVPLDTERELTVNQGEGISNTFRLFPTGFAMAASTCKNQLCVYQGEVTAENMAERPLYHMIVCAPHRLVAELLTGKEVEKTAHEP